MYILFHLKKTTALQGRRFAVEGRTILGSGNPQRRVQAITYRVETQGETAGKMLSVVLL